MTKINDSLIDKLIDIIRQHKHDQLPHPFTEAIKAYPELFPGGNDTGGQGALTDSLCDMYLSKITDENNPIDLTPQRLKRMESAFRLAIGSWYEEQAPSQEVVERVADAIDDITMNGNPERTAKEMRIEQAEAAIAAMSQPVMGGAVDTEHPEGTTNAGGTQAEPCSARNDSNPNLTVQNLSSPRQDDQREISDNQNYVDWLIGQAEMADKGMKANAQWPDSFDSGHYQAQWQSFTDARIRFLATFKPVSVSLETCAAALHERAFNGKSGVNATDRAYAKAVLDAAEVTYVD